MIWLASYPRSGNTFFRIVLDEVYGIESSTFHLEDSYPVDAEYKKYPVVKTHLLPNELIPSDASIPAVYLVRDGRDCMVSLAHYRQRLISPDSDFHQNLVEGIEASQGSHFGGWGNHVREWCKRASLVIRFEDLIADPIGCVEQLRPYLDLPEPRSERLPHFMDLKSKDFKYGSGVQHGFDPQERKHWRESKFRSGRSGGWREELPEPLHLRFLRLYGSELANHGYLDTVGKSDPRSLPSPKSNSRQVHSRRKKASVKKRVLIDVSKLLDSKVDGIKRYVQELLHEMVPIARRKQRTWDLDVCFASGIIFPLLEVAEDLEQVQAIIARIPKLLRPGSENPVYACAERIEELEGQPGLGLFYKTIQLNCLKTVRSSQKRWREMKTLMMRWRNRWEKKFPRRKRSGYDLIHLTLPNTWKSYRLLDTPLLTTVHDLCHIACPEFQTDSNNRSLLAGMHFAEKIQSDYIAVSESTKDQMVQLLNVDPERIRVVHEGCNTERFQPVASEMERERVRTKYGIPDEPYVLSVGTLEPRKNLINTVRAFHRLTEKAPELRANLVIAGSFGWGDAKELQDTIEKCPRVYRIGYVEDVDLAALYSAATVFCYVSHYEGFGLPLLEAMSCGVASVYGDTSSMPEIVAGTGLGASPNDVSQISRQLHELLENSELRRRLSRLAVVRSLDFDWKQSAEQTFACYERFVEKHQGVQTLKYTPDDCHLESDVTEKTGKNNAAA